MFFAKGSDVLLAGVATHYVTSDKLESITNELISKPLDVDKILNQVCSIANQEFSLSPYLKLIKECFSEPTIEDIIAR